jgi:hypothetical protein
MATRREAPISIPKHVSFIEPLLLAGVLRYIHICVNWLQCAFNTYSHKAMCVGVWLQCFYVHAYKTSHTHTHTNTHPFRASAVAAGENVDKPLFGVMMKVGTWFWILLMRGAHVCVRIYTPIHL